MGSFLFISSWSLTNFYGRCLAGHGNHNIKMSVCFATFLAQHRQMSYCVARLLVMAPLDFWWSANPTFCTIKTYKVRVHVHAHKELTADIFNVHEWILLGIEDLNFLKMKTTSACVQEHKCCIPLSWPSDCWYFSEEGLQFINFRKSFLIKIILWRMKSNAQLFYFCFLCWIASPGLWKVRGAEEESTRSTDRWADLMRPFLYKLELVEILSSALCGQKMWAE